MKRQTIALIVFGFVVTGHALAVQIEPPPLPTDRTGLYSTEPASALRQGTFDVNLVITESRKGMSRWLAMTPKERERSVRATRFHPMQKGYLSVVLTNFRGDETNLDLTAQLFLIGPDGKTIYEHRDLGKSAWGNPMQGYLAIRPDVDFTFEKDDPAGTYTYRVIVSDNIRGEVGRAEKKIIFTK